MATPWWLTTKYNFDPERGSSQAFYDATTGRQVYQDANGRYAYTLPKEAQWGMQGDGNFGWSGGVAGEYVPDSLLQSQIQNAQVLGGGGPNGTTRIQLPDGTITYATALNNDAGDYSKLFEGIVPGTGVAQVPGQGAPKTQIVQGSDGNRYAALPSNAQFHAPKPDNSGFMSNFMSGYAPIIGAALPFSGIGNALTSSLGQVGGKVASGAIQSLLGGGNPVVGAGMGLLRGAAPGLNNLANAAQPAAGGTMDDMYGGYGYDTSSAPSDMYGGYGYDTTTYPDPTFIGGSAPTPAASSGGFSGTDWLSKLFSNPGLPGAVVSGAGALLGANTIGNAAQTAANTSAAAADRATQLQAQIYADQIARSQPYYQAGVNALAKYQDPNLTRPFSMADFNADPGYGFRLSEGLKLLQNSAANRGNLLSGNTLKGITNYGQNAASQEYQNAYNRYVQDQATQRNTLANIAGYGPTAGAQAGNAGTNYANTAGSLGMNAANTGANAGLTAAQAQASAYGGIGNAVGNAMSPNPLYEAVARSLGGGYAGR